MFRNNEFTLFGDIVKEMNALATTATPQQKFPRYNIVKLQPKGETPDHELYRVEMALAGYSKEDISITSEMKTHRNTKYQSISVKASKDKKEPEEVYTDPHTLNEYKVDYVERGITKQSFQSQFIALEKDEVVDSTFKDGILTITLKRSFDRDELPIKRIEIK